MTFKVLDSFKIEQFDLHHGQQKEHRVHSDSHISVFSVSQSQDDCTYDTYNIVGDIHVFLNRCCGVDYVLDLPKNILNQ